VEQSPLGDRPVTGAFGQFEGDRRGGPFPRGDLGDGFAGMHAFVMAFEVVAPDEAAGGQAEGGGFFGDA